MVENWSMLKIVVLKVLDIIYLSEKTIATVKAPSLMVFKMEYFIELVVIFPIKNTANKKNASAITKNTTVIFFMLIR